jgi:CarD family transcriptional regulator
MPAHAKPAAQHVVPPKPAAKAPDAAKPATPVVAAAKPAVQAALPAGPVAGAAEVVKTAAPAVAPPTPLAKAPDGPKPPLQPAAPSQLPAQAGPPAPAAVAPAAGATSVAPPARPPEPARPPAPHAGVAKPVSPRPLQVTLQNGRPMPPSRAAAKEEFFVEGDYVVYPTHGVGKVERIATEDIAGHRLELIHITFEENRMTLRVPVTKARSAGLRKLATRKMFDEAMGVLRGRARIKRTMWSRRAQEYEAKINSGDPIAIAEVVRDLHRNAGQPDQSFSERQIYEAAMDRLAAELAALDQTDKLAASVKLVNYLKTV